VVQKPTFQFCTAQGLNAMRGGQTLTPAKWPSTCTTQQTLALGIWGHVPWAAKRLGQNSDVHDAIRDCMLIPISNYTIQNHISDNWSISHRTQKRKHYYRQCTLILFSTDKRDAKGMQILWKGS
jgi:hypothetical protein